MNRYYTFLYTCNDGVPYKESCIQHLNVCKGSIVLNYEHMLPLEYVHSSLDNFRIEMRTHRTLGDYGKYLEMPLNEAYYYLVFTYSDVDKQYTLSDSSFFQVCSRNGNSCMECVKYTLINEILQ